MTWLLLPLAFAVQLDADDRQMRLNADMKVAVDAEGRMHMDHANWLFIPSNPAPHGDLFYIPSTDTDTSELAAQVKQLSTVANVYVPDLGSGDLETQLAKVFARFADYEVSYRGNRAMALAGVGDGAKMLNGLLEQRAGRWGQQLAAAFLVPDAQDGFTQPGGLGVCQYASEAHCFVSWMAELKCTEKNEKKSFARQSVCVNPLSWQTGTAMAESPLPRNAGVIHAGEWSPELHTQCDSQNVLQVNPSATSLLQSVCKDAKKSLSSKKSFSTFLPSVVSNLKQRFHSVNVKSKSVVSHIEKAKAPLDVADVSAVTESSPSLTAAEGTRLMDSVVTTQDAIVQGATNTATTPYQATSNVQAKAPSGPHLACAEAVLEKVKAAGGLSIDSSSSEPDYGALKVILNKNGAATDAWKPAHANGEQYVEMDFGSAEFVIRFMQTSGAVQKFKIQYWNKDSAAWQWYKVSGDAAAWTQVVNTWTFPDYGLIPLDPPIKANKVRLWPTTWSSTGPSLRAEMRGCDASTVQEDKIELDVPHGDLIGTVFTSESTASTQLRTHIADSLQTSADRIAVAAIKANGLTSDVSLYILPKDGETSPSALQATLTAVLQEDGSSLQKFLDGIESAPKNKATAIITSKTCVAVDCGGRHGHCAGGQCYCVKPWTGDSCQTDSSLPADKQSKEVSVDENGNELDENGEIIKSAVEDIKPLGVMKDAESPPEEKGDRPGKIAASEVEEDVQAIGEKAKEEAIDEQEGFSGTVARHAIILAIVGVVALAAGGYLVSQANTRKYGGGAGGDDEDLARVSLRE